MYIESLFLIHFAVEHHYFRVEKEQPLLRYSICLSSQPVFMFILLDDVLPEYVVLLLANRHPKEKIMGDLEALLGAETASLFTTWLFEEVERLKSILCTSFNSILIRWHRYC